MINRSNFMKSVWMQYRRTAFPGRPFDRKHFALCLTFMWKGERVRIQAERERRALAAQPVVVASPVRTAPMSEMERRIDGLKFLSTRYRIDLMEREIRAEYGA